MSQVRENLTALTGTIETRSAHPELPGYDVVRVRVDTAGPAGDKPDLIGAAPGDTVDVAVPTGSLEPGTQVHLHARLAAPGRILGEVREGHIQGD